MAFGKKAKQVKTQYETENQTLGRDAYSKMAPALNRYSDLAMNPDEYRQKYLNEYYGADSAQNSDFLRNYRRQMSNATANNYAATHGGYSSAGNKYYNDVQRSQNDLASRLQDYGVQGANSLYNTDFANTQNYYGILKGTHDLAQAPDAIDAYNDQINKANKQWWTNALSSVGNVVEAAAPGWWKAIGTGMKLAGNAGSTDYSDNLARLSGQFGGSSDSSQFKNSATDLAGLASSGVGNWLNWGGLSGGTTNPTQDDNGSIFYTDKNTGKKMIYNPQAGFAIRGKNN